MIGVITYKLYIRLWPAGGPLPSGRRRYRIREFYIAAIINFANSQFCIILHS